MKNNFSFHFSFLGVTKSNSSNFQFLLQHLCTASSLWLESTVQLAFHEERIFTADYIFIKTNALKPPVFSKRKWSADKRLFYLGLYYSLSLHRSHFPTVLMILFCWGSVKWMYLPTNHPDKKIVCHKICMCQTSMYRL